MFNWRFWVCVGVGCCISVTITKLTDATLTSALIGWCAGKTAVAWNRHANG